MTNKLILDACCGSRMFWFDRGNPGVEFVDNRTLHTTLCDGRRLDIEPDTIADFRALPYEDESFYHVVFDPPHMTSLGENSWMAKKYGRLDKNWRQTIHDGFHECMRVLKPHGTLIFKWNEHDIKVSEILETIGAQPLYGHKSGKLQKTHWLVFYKEAKESGNHDTA